MIDCYVVGFLGFGVVGFDGFWVVGLLGCLVGWQQPNNPTTQHPTTQQPKDNPRQQPTQQRHKKQKRQQGQKRQPNHPPTKLDGPAECAKRSAAPPGCGVLDEPQVCQDLVVLGVPCFLFLSLSFASIFLFLTPPKPSPAPSAFRRAVRLFALPAVFVNFLCLFPHAKKTPKKSSPQFSYFACNFSDFQYFSSNSGPFRVHSGTLPGFIFRYFWDSNFAMFFGTFFKASSKMQKNTKRSKHRACAWF